MLIRRCDNCKFEFGFRRTEMSGFTDGYCPECHFWISHYNHWRRRYDKNPTAINLIMKNICKSFIKDKQKPLLLTENEDSRIMRKRGNLYVD